MSQQKLPRKWKCSQSNLSQNLFKVMRKKKFRHVSWVLRYKRLSKLFRLYVQKPATEKTRTKTGKGKNRGANFFCKARGSAKRHLWRTRQLIAPRLQACWTLDFQLLMEDKDAKTAASFIRRIFVDKRPQQTFKNFST